MNESPTWNPNKYNSVSYSSGKLQTYDQQQSSRAVSTATKIRYNEKLVNDIMLIPNGVNEWNRERYELTGYINDINTQNTQVLMEFGFGGTIGLTLGELSLVNKSTTLGV